MLLFYGIEGRAQGTGLVFRPALRWATREYLHLSAGFAGDDIGKGEPLLLLYGSEGRSHWSFGTNKFEHFTKRYFCCSGSAFQRPCSLTIFACGILHNQSVPAFLAKKLHVLSLSL